MKPQSPDTSVQMERIQIEMIRRAPISRKFASALSLSQAVMQLSRRAIHRADPNLDQRGIDLAFVEFHYGAELAGRLRKYLEIADETT